MKKWNLKKTFLEISSILSIFVFLILPVRAQSTDQSFPTPVSSNEISGTIKARDLGDARLTSYFYVFNGNQGDVFINVVTKNFDGDIDVFTADNLRPLTKIVVYSDNPDSETGRVIYLRKQEKLILRIEGRTPNDDPATFRIKFAGSFQAITNIKDQNENSEQPTVKNGNQGEVRVNSVGTIIETRPTPTPTPKVKVSKTEPEESKKETETAEKSEKETKPQIETGKKPTAEKENETGKNKTEQKKSDKKYKVVVTDNLPEKENPEQTVEDKKENPPENSETEKPTEKDKITDENSDDSNTAKKEVKPKPKKTEPVKEPNPLENIRLIVLFKDGTKIERPMSEVLKVSVDKGVLTIIAKDGSIGRYSILDVAKMTIE